MAVLIGAAQRRFLVLGSTGFFVFSLWYCISHLFAMQSSTTEVKKVHHKEPFVFLDFNKADYPMSYGLYRRPGYDDIMLMDSLPKEFVPTKENKRRLIVIGDIHGMLDPLNALLKATKFDPVYDHVISVGDMVNKGPKSAQVVQRLMDINATAVRGNHEDRVLVAWQGVQHQTGVEAFVDSPAAAMSRGEGEDVKTARTLSETQIEWLQSLPVILSIEPMSLYVVHAGLVPGLPLVHQDPWAIMNMRTLRFPREEYRAKEIEKERKKQEKLEKEKKEKEKKEKEKKEKEKQEKEKKEKEKQEKDSKKKETKKDEESEGAGGDSKPVGKRSVQVDKDLPEEKIVSSTDDATAVLMSHPDHDIWIPIDTREGEPWSNIWNHFQKNIPAHQRRSIIYGHDAKRGYREDSFTFGLDSGCVKGNALSALIISVGDNGEFQTTTRQTLCKAP